MSDQTPHEMEQLAPIGAEQRIFTGTSYVLMWWASLIVVQLFSIGQGLLPPIGKLNLLQGIVAILTAVTLSALCMTLNGHAGLRWGIPYCIQARACFGVRGARFPEVVRMLPALIWYGVGTWIAVLSLDGICKTLFDFSPPNIKYVYFVIFQALQTWLAYKGVKIMKAFTVSASIVLVALMFYMLIHIIRTYGFEISEAWRIPGSWGLPFWIGVNTIIGTVSTVFLNISDLTRYLEKKQKNLWLIHLVCILPPFFFILFLGLVAGTSLGIWDPIEALMRLSPDPITMILLLLFIFFAQFTTNLTINILPPALIMEDLFKINWGTATIVTGIVGTLTMPWIVLSSAEILFTVIAYFSAILGPILGCMLADYYLHRQHYDIEQLYREDDGGLYWYRNGINPNSILVVVAVTALTMAYFVQIAWLIGFPLSFIAYLVLQRSGKQPV